jgi:hypothetical protein
MFNDIKERPHHPKASVNFKTPEQTAAAEEKTKPAIETIALEDAPKKIKKKRRLTKKHIIIGSIALAVIILGIGGWFIYKHYHHSVIKPGVTKAIIVKPVPTTVASTLSGLPVAPSLNKLPVTGIMIENEIDSRPQSGLDQAGVVFEALAEGGITRFLALYQDTQPSYIGPIRSARPYYVSWCMGFDCDYAHVGGSPDALTDISSWGVNDLNQFYNGSAYERITSREAPHNVYSSIASLNTLEDSKGYTTSNFQGFPRKVATPLKVPTATTLNLDIGSAEYNVSYSYNAADNNYVRSEAGQLMTNVDADGTLVQIAPKVVIAIIVPFSQGALDASDAYYSNYAIIGSGAAYVFQDGGVTVGTWQKTSNSAQITFTDSQNQTIKLDPGQTWITALTDSSQLTY